MMSILSRVAIFTFIITSVSCKSLVSVPPVTEKKPDIISTPTTTVVPKDTNAELPKGTWLKTDQDQKTEVVLQQDTVVTVKPATTDVPTVEEKPLQVVLPKNTEVILPEQTHVLTTDTSKVKIEASSEVVLPVGTEVSITKVNWYAIMFYCLVIGGLAWYYMQGKNEDKNQDGFVDETKKKDSAPS